MKDIKGIIFDFGGTIDTNGIHWSEVIRLQYTKAGVNIENETYRAAYVHGERTLAKKRIITPQHTFLRLLEEKIAIQFEHRPATEDCGRLLQTDKRDNSLHLLHSAKNIKHLPHSACNQFLWKYAGGAERVLAR